MAKGGICPLCQQVITDTTGQYCQKCYNYLRRHPEGTYPLPPKGVVARATNGDFICHICGKAYCKLGNHIFQCHHMSQKAYREEFGLYHNTRLCHDAYHSKMREYNVKYYDKVVKQNLIVGGQSTRINDNKLPKRRKGKTVATIDYKEEL